MSNVIPKLKTYMFKALVEKRDEEADKLQEEVNVIRDVNRLATMPSVLKRALELGNIAEAGPARKPVFETTPELDEKIKEMLKHYGLI